MYVENAATFDLVVTFVIFILDLLVDFLHSSHNRVCKPIQIFSDMGTHSVFYSLGGKDALCILHIRPRACCSTQFLPAEKQRYPNFFVNMFTILFWTICSQ